MNDEPCHAAIVAAADGLLQDRDRLVLLIGGTHGVWRHHAPHRPGYKDLDALGNTLYHLTGGVLGQCVRYDDPECLSDDEQRARYGLTWAEIDAMPLGASFSGELGPLPEPKLGRLDRPDLFTGVAAEMGWTEEELTNE